MLQVFGVILEDCIDVRDNLPEYLEALSFEPERHACDPRIFPDDFRKYAIEESFSLVLQGHDHYREELVYENVNYTVVGAIADKCKLPEYLKIEVTPEKLIFEWHQISDLHYYIHNVNQNVNRLG